MVKISQIDGYRESQADQDTHDKHQEENSQEAQISDEQISVLLLTSL